MIIFPGNLRKLNFTYKEEKYGLAALYAPNTKYIPFFQALFEMETYPATEHTLYTGDWNISLSQQLDTHENNTHTRDFVKAKMIHQKLNDVWKTKNPFEINYTFMKKQARNTTKARLDFLLASQKTLGYIESIIIENQTSLPDHRPLSFTIAKNKIENGPGYWRFENDLLEGNLVWP